MAYRGTLASLLLHCSMCFAVQPVCPESIHETLEADQEFPHVGVQRLAFGSCGHQNKPWPVVDVGLSYSPDLFLLLGDNLYGDTLDISVLSQAYETLGNHPDFTRLWRSSARVLSSWDDHDYGWNDAGRTFPLRNQSKQLFLDFFREPLGSVRRQRDGIFASYHFGPPDQRVQVILLDLRSFRDDLKVWEGDSELDRRAFYYARLFSPFGPEEACELLGEAQWAWLEHQLTLPAQVRLICTSTQFGVEANGYEAWANFPREVRRMQALIASTRANGVLFLSGDVHYAELSKVLGGPYPLYDFTSSGLSQTWGFAAPNANRIAGPVMENHIGVVDIAWSGVNTSLRLRTVHGLANGVAVALLKQQSCMQTHHHVSVKMDKASPSGHEKEFAASIQVRLSPSVPHVLLNAHSVNRIFPHSGYE